MGAPETHNRLVRDMVMKMGRETHSYSELMILVESFILSAMLLNARLYDCSPAVASGLVEAAVQRAIERFAQKEHRDD